MDRMALLGGNLSPASLPQVLLVLLGRGWVWQLTASNAQAHSGSAVSSARMGRRCYLHSVQQRSLYTRQPQCALGPGADAQPAQLYRGKWRAG